MAGTDQVNLRRANRSDIDEGGSLFRVPGRWIAKETSLNSRPRNPAAKDLAA